MVNGMREVFPATLPRLGMLRILFQAAIAQQVTLADMRLRVPGPLPIRLAVVMGNLRMQRMFDRLLHPGATVVDVGANIGYNTFYAAQRVGHSGRVYAIEPAQDNLAVLYANLFANGLTNVFVLPYAAGIRHEVKQFFLRGEVSAVNSLFSDNFYAVVTDTTEVLTAPLDDLIPVTPDLVKIDVEGAELDVLQGHVAHDRHTELSADCRVASNAATGCRSCARCPATPSLGPRLYTLRNHPHTRCAAPSRRFAHSDAPTPQKAQPGRASGHPVSAAPCHLVTSPRIRTALDTTWAVRPGPLCSKIAQERVFILLSAVAALRHS